MRNRPGRDVRPGSISLQLSGWLFADLLLGAMMVFLAAIPGLPKEALLTPTPTATPAAGATPTPTATATPTATPTPECVRTAVLKKNVFHVPGVVANGVRTTPTTPDLRQAFAKVQGRRAGLVLTYAHAPNDGEGQRLAGEVNTRLRQAHPSIFTDETIYEVFDYKDRSPAAYGAVQFEIYFLSDSCADGAAP